VRSAEALAAVLKADLRGVVREAVLTFEGDSVALAGHPGSRARERRAGLARSVRMARSSLIGRSGLRARGAGASAAARAESGVIAEGSGARAGLVAEGAVALVSGAQPRGMARLLRCVRAKSRAGVTSAVHGTIAIAAVAVRAAGSEPVGSLEAAAVKGGLREARGRSAVAVPQGDRAVAMVMAPASGSSVGSRISIRTARTCTGQLAHTLSSAARDARVAGLDVAASVALVEEGVQAQAAARGGQASEAIGRAAAEPRALLTTTSA